jgi:maltooligosyltrehalose synthase
MEAALALFRGSVRDWSDGQRRAEPPAMGSILPARGRRTHPMRWALLAAVLLVLAAVPVYRTVQDRQRQAEIARADALLLEQVDAEVSRAVPRPMEPLATLVSWDFSSNDGRDEKTRNEEIR